MEIKEYFKLLGHEVKDKVSEIRGVVNSIGFDLFGCIQAEVRPIKLNHEGKLSGFWLDISRLEILTDKPLMEPPDFVWEKKPEKRITGEGGIDTSNSFSNLKGPADKSICPHSNMTEKY